MLPVNSYSASALQHLQTPSFGKLPSIAAWVPDWVPDVFGPSIDILDPNGQPLDLIATDELDTTVTTKISGNHSLENAYKKAVPAVKRRLAALGFTTDTVMPNREKGITQHHSSADDNTTVHLNVKGTRLTVPDSIRDQYADQHRSEL